MFLLKEKPPRTSFDPSGSKSRSQGGVNFIIANETIDEKESKIHHAGFLISPTTHLFPLAGQSGSRGVSSMINFEIKIWNNKKCYQSIQSYITILS